MNSEIKRILKLASIPGFKISEKEQKMLDEWKSQQVPVEPPKKKRTYKKKAKSQARKEKIDAPVDAPEALETIEEPKVYNEPIKVQNVVEKADKSENEE